MAEQATKKDQKQAAPGPDPAVAKALSRSSSRGAGQWLLEWVKSISVALVVWFFLRTFLLEAFRIPSGSMENTLLVGDFLFVNKYLYGAEVPLIHKRLPAYREPRRDEILVFDSVEEEGLKVVKRLIEKELPGVGEQIRRYGQDRTPMSMLSRSVCGVMGDKVVLALPGSPGGVTDALRAVLPHLLHVLDVLQGAGHGASR